MKFIFHLLNLVKIIEAAMCVGCENSVVDFTASDEEICQIFDE